MDTQDEVTSTILDLTRIVRALRLAHGVLLRSASEQDLFNDMCRAIVEVGEYRMAWVGIARDDAERSVRPVAFYGISRSYLETARITWGDDAHGRGPTGRAIKTGKVQVNADFATDTSMEAWRKMAASQGYVSSIALPIKFDETVIGALTIYSSEADVFDSIETDLLADLADDISFGVTALRRRDLAAGAAEKLRAGLEKTVELLAETMEVRDPYTAGHQRRVAGLACAIAGEIGLSVEETRGIYLAGLVHDIGKFSVPSDILAKASHLSSEEMALVKTHSKTGYDIIKHVEFPWPIADIVLQHHERLDGSGYPGGLKGDAICRGARVLAVADVVEAMMSHRPYRPGLGLDMALAEIVDHRGVLYEPAAVDACVALFKSTRFQFD